MQASATYYIGSKGHKGFIVRQQNVHDGLQVDLAEKPDAEPFVRCAPVSATPEPGHAVLSDPAEEEAAAKAEAEAAKAEAEAEAKAKGKAK